MTVRDRLSLVGALAVLLAASALRPVFASVDWLPATAGAVAVVVAASALARRTRLPAAAAPLLPLLALGGYVCVVFARGSLAAGVLPTRETVRALRVLLTATGTDLSQYATPAPTTRPLVLLAVGGVGLVAVVVDALASVAARPAVAGVPLLALFAVPSAVLPGGLGWLPFALGAAGWLALLLVEGRDRAARWGTAVRATGGDAGLGRVGRRIGGAALGVAVLVPALVPGLDGQLFEGSGSGSGGSGTRSVTTYNPITRLRGQLTLPEPTPVLHYRTDDRSPDYLRMTTLGIYDGSGWRQEVLRGNLRDNGVTGAALPLPLGRDLAARTRTVTTRVSVDSLDAFWLPAPATPDRVQVSGPWMWDAGSGSVFATRSNTGKVKEYAVESTRVLPDGGALVAGEDVVPAQVQPYAAPVDATPRVKAITKRVVDGQTTSYGKALALQDFFRSPRFTYDESTSTGGSPDALQDFLTQRRGFCEQYASAMAAMLRLSGVPARVAVGFTPGTRQPDGSYVVTTSDAHAWPEAWFGGLGWVRFEPTPSQGAIAAPAYGAVPAPTQAAPGQPGPAGAAPETAGPDGAETAAQRHQRLLDEREQVAPADAPPGAAPAATPPGGRPLRELGVGVLVLLFAAGPAALHALRRHRRWRSPTAGVAWAQLADDATDTGHAWRGADSPRTAGVRLVADAGLSGEAAGAVQRLTAAVERERFARPGSVAVSADGLGADTAAVRRALRARASRGHRLRALLLPPSTAQWVTSGLGSRTADGLDAADRAFAAVGGRLRRRSA